LRTTDNGEYNDNGESAEEDEHQYTMGELQQWIEENKTMLEFTFSAGKLRLDLVKKVDALGEAHGKRGEGPGFPFTAYDLEAKEDLKLLDFVDWNTFKAFQTVP
jgi:hypothetical protein